MSIRFRRHLPRRKLLSEVIDSFMPRQQYFYDVCKKMSGLENIAKNLKRIVKEIY